MLCFFKRKRQSKEEGLRLLSLPSLSPVPTTWMRCSFCLFFFFFLNFTSSSHHSYSVKSCRWNSKKEKAALPTRCPHLLTWVPFRVLAGWAGTFEWERGVTRVALGFHFVGSVWRGARHCTINLSYASIYEDGIAWI